MTAAAADRLAELGQGFAWHLDGEPRWQALLDDVRRAVADDEHLPGSSPLAAEGAIAFAGRLAATLEPGARVLLVDTDSRLADALLGLGHEVVARVPRAALPLWSGVRARHSSLVVVERAVHEADPDELRAFDAAAVDLAPNPGQWTPRLARAIGATRVGGRVGVALHPQQREHGREQLVRLPAALVDRHDESCGRLIATSGARGPRLALSDYPADQWILAVEHGALPLDPAGAWPADTLDEHEPPFARHGICEFHDARAEVEPEALERALALAAARAGVDVTGGHGHARDGFVHRFVALAGGGHITATLDRAAGVVSCGVWRWTPSLEAALASAFLDEVDAREAPVILTAAAP